MTVCIAGINHSNLQPYIIAACDRKISFFGGWAASEGLAMKMAGINKNWTVMFSGPVSTATALVDAIVQRTQNLKPMGFRKFARLCREAYRQERRLLIESEVLGDYDIDTYAEFSGLAKSDPQWYAKVHEEVKRVESEWGLLFAGFDKTRKAHVFTITENGKISFWDEEGFAAIGSGAWRALLSLSSYPLKRKLPLSEAIFGVAAAKFSAEMADGVGEETVLTILEPSADASPVFPDHTINKLRDMWIKLPRFPEGATTQIWGDIAHFQVFGYLGKNCEPKRSASERSILEP